MSGRFAWLEVLVGQLDRASTRVLSTSNLGVAVSAVSGRLALLVADPVVHHAVILRANHEVCLVRRMAACSSFIQACLSLLVAVIAADQISSGA